MAEINIKLTLLKEHLESAAFLVSKGASEKEAHSEIIKSLIIVSDLEGQLLKHGEPLSDEGADQDEVKKVNRRLKLWAKRPHQINSKILNAYLKLKRSGLTVITESLLKSELTEKDSFETNFVQMKIIAEKNHGKVFEQYGENITLWKPVLAGIQEYENIVFGSNNS